MRVADAASPRRGAGLIRRNAAFIGTFSYLTLRLALSRVLLSNEADVLPAARHFVEPGWLATDWYLGLGIGYRYPFNVLAGALASVLPLWVTAIVGRVLSFALFAAVLQAYLRALRVRAALAVPLVALFVTVPSLGAGEWMVKCFETKSFAYLAILAGILALGRRRHGWSAALLGVGVSFHVLVGLYAVGAVALAVVLERRRAGFDARALAKAIPAFLVSASPGIYAALQTILENAGSDTALGAFLYVTWRVPHHVLPSSFGRLWAPLVLAYVALFLAARACTTHPERRWVASVALCSSVFILIGTLLFAAGRLTLLRYYWFRFPDTIMPLFGAMLMAALLDHVVDRAAAWSRSRWSPRAVAAGLLGASALVHLSLYAHAATGFALDAWRFGKSGGDAVFAGLPPDLLDVLRWTRHATDPRSTLLVSPTIEQAYVLTERPQFVLWKSSPQSERDVVEWARRISLANDGQPLATGGFAGRARLEANFYGMSAGTLQEIRAAYGVDYLVTRTTAPYALRRVYENGSYVVFDLR